MRGIEFEGVCCVLVFQGLSPSDYMAKKEEVADRIVERLEVALKAPRLKQGTHFREVGGWWGRGRRGRGSGDGVARPSFVCIFFGFFNFLSSSSWSRNGSLLVLGSRRCVHPPTLHAFPVPFQSTPRVSDPGVPKSNHMHTLFICLNKKFKYFGIHLK